MKNQNGNNFSKILVFIQLLQNFAMNQQKTKVGIEPRTYRSSKAPELFLPGGQNLKKGTFFVEKALPTKSNFGSHAAI